VIKGARQRDSSLHPSRQLLRPGGGMTQSPTRSSASSTSVKDADWPSLEWIRFCAQIRFSRADRKGRSFMSWKTKPILPARRACSGDWPFTRMEPSRHCAAGPGGAGEEAKQGALAGAGGTDQAADFPRRDLEGDVAQRRTIGRVKRRSVFDIRSRSREQLTHVHASRVPRQIRLDRQFPAGQRIVRGSGDVLATSDEHHGKGPFSTIRLCQTWSTSRFGSEPGRRRRP
jgi:hypothetical protein